MTHNTTSAASPPATKLKEDAKEPDEGEDKMKTLRELARKSLDAAESTHAENVRLKAELATLRAKEFPPKGATEAEKPTLDPVKDDNETHPAKEGVVRTPKANTDTAGALTSKGETLSRDEVAALLKAQREELLKELRPVIQAESREIVKGLTPRPGQWGTMTREDRWTKLKGLIQQAVTADRRHAGGAFDMGLSEGNFGFKSPANDPMALAATEHFVKKMLVAEGLTTEGVF